MNRVPCLAGLIALAAVPPALAQNGAANDFNPAISLSLMGQYAAYSRAVELELPGFPLGGEAALPEEGFSLDHTELTFSANIDPYFYGQVTAAVASHEGKTELELEEAYIEAQGLPAGLGLSFGRFLSGIGYLNSRHSHAWDFIDAPLPALAFLGGSYYDDGARLSWLAPTALFLEVGAEAFRGGNFPAAASDGGGIGSYSLFAHLGGDFGLSHSWQLGLSQLRAEPEGRTGDAHAHGGVIDSFAFSGDSTLTVVDAVWKWAPAGNAQARSLVLQGEYYHRDEDGRVGNDDGSEVTRYRGSQQGFYGQAVYRFRPRWRLGGRYDRLWSDNRGADAELLREASMADRGEALQRYSAMLDFSISEFSRLRLQYTRSDLGDGIDHAGFLQYVMTLGAHGAHRF